MNGLAAVQAITSDNEDLAVANGWSSWKEVSNRLVHSRKLTAKAPKNGGFQ